MFDKQTELRNIKNRVEKLEEISKSQDLLIEHVRTERALAERRYRNILESMKELLVELESKFE